MVIVVNHRRRTSHQKEKDTPIVRETPDDVQTGKIISNGEIKPFEQLPTKGSEHKDQTDTVPRDRTFVSR